MRHAFSLVELSIVLVILGLLTGGILAGQSLIRAAELRSVTSDFERYKTAYYSFRDQYMAIPGDMNNATSFWGVLAGDGTNAACQDTAATGLPTCNGNGDAQVRHASVNWSERLRVWQHLANAQLIEGSYTGKSNGASGTFTTVIGTNVPGAKIGNAYWDIVYLSVAGTIWFPTADLQRNSLTLYSSSGYALSPEEAWNVDTKLDDGLPPSGKVLSTIRSYAGCTTSDTSDAQYDVSVKDKRCLLTLGLD